jgi:membrane associated rhomboid family serine protease
MSKQRPETLLPDVRLTPWVGRLMLVNAVLLVLLQTVFTAPGFPAVLRFVPAQAVDRPWTFLSYMFVHSGLLSLGGNLLLLLIFGPAVERRLGGRGFLLYYLFCGIGTAAFTLGLSSFMTLPPLLGATGAALGVALAFAFAEPEAKLVLFPFERPFSARALVLFLSGVNVVLALWLNDGLAHLGYLGGLATGYVLFRIQSLVGRRQPKEPKSIARRPVMAPIPVRQGGTITEVRPALARPEPREEYPAEEVDRVLDKISAFGIQSLTAEERRFLNEVSKRKRKDLH